MPIIVQKVLIILNHNRFPSYLTLLISNCKKLEKAFKQKHLNKSNGAFDKISSHEIVDIEQYWNLNLNKLY